MKRRDFIKMATALSIAGTKVPLMAFNRPKHLRKSSGNWGSDRIVILIKLNGGNDGLNTLIPVQDSIYYNKRPNLGIKARNALPINYDTYFHPSLVNSQSLFQQGMMSIVHAVGYPAGNLSHFRSSDIWVTASGSNRVWNTGWLGRMFAYDYPDYPANIPDHPIGIQMGSANLLEFQTPETNMATMLGSTDSLYKIIDENYVAGSNDSAPPTYGGEELKYVRAIDESTYEFSGVINDAGQKGKNTLEYPATNLGLQMAVAAKLISGGLTTPVYRLNYSGFDTHANQWNNHIRLLRELDQAVFAFLKDLGSQGLVEKVLLVTTSEFGRRVMENGSVGTDHGTAGPTLFYGPPLRGNIIGSQPPLNDLIRGGNLKVQHDYRQIYSTIMQDWFGLAKDTVKDILEETYDPVSVIHEPLSADKDVHLPSNFKLHPAYPNPFNPAAEIGFEIPQESIVKISVYTITGRRILHQDLGAKHAGNHSYTLVPKGWASGTYIVQIEALGSVLTQQITYLK
ncbi:MAG: DUF1501 domain-containing protein [Candidatus Marinimicrobia bacterium]|nr:DUF1501 domain-containing protein [Candidatus Neomarinimicrobiota bacterium]